MKLFATLLFAYCMVSPQFKVCGLPPLMVCQDMAAQFSGFCVLQDLDPMPEEE